MPLPNLRDKLDQKIFDAIYSRSLVYNTCWEDPGRRPQGARARARRHGARDHERRLQRTRLRARGAEAHPRGGCESAPDRPARAQDRRHPRARVRRFLRASSATAITRASTSSTTSICARRCRRSRETWWDRHRRWFTSPRGSLLFPWALRHRRAHGARVFRVAPAASRGDGRSASMRRRSPSSRRSTTRASRRCSGTRPSTGRSRASSR